MSPQAICPPFISLSSCTIAASLVPRFPHPSLWRLLWSGGGAGGVPVLGQAVYTRPVMTVGPGDSIQSHPSWGGETEAGQVRCPHPAGLLQDEAQRPRTCCLPTWPQDPGTEANDSSRPPSLRNSSSEPRATLLPQPLLSVWETVPVSHGPTHKHHSRGSARRSAGNTASLAPSQAPGEPPISTWAGRGCQRACRGPSPASWP